MKCLRIKNGKCQFCHNGNDYIDVDRIGKDDILKLLDIATDEELDFEMDEFDDDKIKNPVHKIIYRNLCEKFSELLNHKSQFLDESEAVYKDALQKYKI